MILIKWRKIYRANMNPEKAPVILTFENFKEKKWSIKKLLHSLK